MVSESPATVTVDLKQDLAQKLEVGENQITIGNGSNDVLDLVARSFLDGAAEAVYSQYAFMVYAMVTQACGAHGRAAEAMAADSASPYGHDLDAMLAAVNDSTRVVFIAKVHLVLVKQGLPIPPLFRKSQIRILNITSLLCIRQYLFIKF